MTHELKYRFERRGSFDYPFDRAGELQFPCVLDGSCGHRVHGYTDEYVYAECSCGWKMFLGINAVNNDDKDEQFRKAHYTFFQHRFEELEKSLANPQAIQPTATYWQNRYNDLRAQCEGAGFPVSNENVADFSLYRTDLSRLAAFENQVVTLRNGIAKIKATLEEMPPR